jgi:hypothetical protein
MGVELDAFSQQLGELVRAFRAKEISCERFWEQMYNLWLQEGQRYKEAQAESLGPPGNG